MMKRLELFLIRSIYCISGKLTVTLPRGAIRWGGRMGAVLNMPYSAAAVGNEFLALGRQESIPIDQMKLQKLIFYAHAWYLAGKDEPLIEDEIEAWPWGPVVRSVYTQTVGCGRGPVSADLTAFEKTGNSILDWTIRVPRIDSEEDKNYIKAVWDIHKAFTGIQLSNSTHAPGEPWTVVKQQYGNLDSKPPIPSDLIKAIFKKKIENANNSSAA